MIAEAVKIYNNERLHWSLELKTPQEVHRKYNQQYKSYARKFA
jgi:transposase InsO family protein